MRDGFLQLVSLNGQPYCVAHPPRRAASEESSPVSAVVRAWTKVADHLNGAVEVYGDLLRDSEDDQDLAEQSKRYIDRYSFGDTHRDMPGGQMVIRYVRPTEKVKVNLPRSVKQTHLKTLTARLHLKR